MGIRLEIGLFYSQLTFPGMTQSAPISPTELVKPFTANFSLSHFAVGGEILFKVKKGLFSVPSTKGCSFDLLILSDTNMST
jgi:hypothetical protein